MRYNTSHNPPADMWKGIFFATMICLLLFGAGFANHYMDVKQRAQNASEVIQTLSEERRELAREKDSLKRLANLRHPETRWLARVIYSESNRPREQRLIAWEVRNRVEQNFRGRSTYRGVALDNKQYSAFNSANELRLYYMTKNWMDAGDNTRIGKAWARALEIAHEVRTRPEVFRPFGEKVLYHYSEISMPSWKPHPEWRSAFTYVDMDGVNPYRLRFYKDPECRLCGEMGPVPNTSSDYKTASIQEHRELTID